MSQVTLYELPPSPNNVKVRAALGYKGIDYRSELVNPMDRSAAIAAYGVGLTPGLRWGDVRLYDSHAILRLLDLNFAGPRLYPEDVDALREVEGWERWARNEGFNGLGAPFAMALGRAEHDEAVITAARGEVTANSRRLEEALADRKWLVGDAMTAADICAASRAVLICPPEAIRAAVVAAEVPVWPFLFEHCAVEEDRPRTRAFVERVLQHDRWLEGLKQQTAAG